MSKVSLPSLIIRLENLGIGLVGLTLYYYLGLSWAFFAIFILAPDLSMLGYLLNPKIGSITYNLVHNYLAALLLLILSSLAQPELFLALAIILTIHIGFDRALSLGLKYPSAFKPTHLQKI